MKLIWPTVVVTVLVAVGVVAYVVFGVVLSTTDLRSGELEFEAREDGGNDHIVRFFDDEGDEIAKVFVRANQRSENGYSLLVEFTHQVDTNLDSFSLRFDFATAARLALRTPPWGWDSIEYRHTQDSRGVLVSVPDLGDLGRGTVVLDLLLGQDYFGGPPLPESPRLDVSLTLSKRGFSFGKQRGEATLELRLAPGLAIASAR